MREPGMFRSSLGLLGCLLAVLCCWVVAIVVLALGVRLWKVVAG